MIQNFNKYLIGIFCALLLVACDSNSEKTQKTLESRLVDSFTQSDQAVRDQVEAIVSASKDKDYQRAMNGLGILAGSKIHSKEQSQAIRFLMTQLRYSLEDEDLLKKTQQDEN